MSVIYKNVNVSFDVNNGFIVSGELERIPYQIIRVPVVYNSEDGMVEMRMTVEAAKDITALVNGFIREMRK